MEEKAALNRLRRTKKSNLGERAHYVLLSAEGKSVQEISAHLSCNIHNRAMAKALFNGWDSRIKQS